jgi:hypothetical protein
MKLVLHKRERQTNRLVFVILVGLVCIELIALYFQLMPNSIVLTTGANTL